METNEWRVRLICCGREAGVEYFETYRDADLFRESYTTGPSVNLPDGTGHDRAAIVERNW